MPRFKLLSIALIALACGCPTKKRQLRAPAEPDVPRDGDQNALRRFEDSRTRFFQDKAASAQITEEFESIAREYPDDPIVGHALLYAGMSATRSGDYDAAIENLDKLADEADDDQLIKRGRLYRGIARNYKGDHAGAVSDLEAASDAVNSDNEYELIEWLAAMAVALDKSQKVDRSLEYYDRWWLARATPSERSFIEDRVKNAVASLDESLLEGAYGTLVDKKGPAAAHLGVRLAAALSATDADRAERIRAETEDARKRFGLAVGALTGGKPGDPARLGAIMPLTGGQNRLGNRTGRGVTLAASFASRAGTGAANGWPKRFTLLMRDSSSEATRAVAGLEALDRDDVIGVVGPVDRRATAESADVATRLGMPMVSLTTRPEAESSPWVFHAVHSAEQRARSLARYAIKKGVKDFAVFAPNNGYGRAVGDAFADEVKRLGGKVTSRARYGKPNEANKAIRKTRVTKKPFQAIFIPDSARALALVAPALSAALLQSRPLGFKGRVRGKKTLMLSTAEAIDDNFIRQAGRHAWGAVFAPGFYADTRHPRIGRFVSRYTRAFNRQPIYLDAYAFDAALAVRAAVEAGAATRAEVAEKLAQIQVEGITGKLQFDAGHMRADDGVLYTVKELNSSFVIEAIP